MSSNIGSGFYGKVGAIEIQNSVIETSGGGVGVVPSGSVASIYISNSSIEGPDPSLDKGAGGGGYVGFKNTEVTGSITVVNGSYIRPNATSSPVIANYNGDIYISQTSLDALDATKAYQDDTQTYPGIGGNNGVYGDVHIIDDDDWYEEAGEETITTTTTVTTTTTTLGNELKIHHGTKANQATNFYINDMHTKSLGTGDLLDSDGNFLKEEDEERYWALSYDKTKQAAWLDTITAAQNKNLDTIDVKECLHEIKVI